MAVTCGRCGWQGHDAAYCARCGADLAARAAPPPASFPQAPPKTAAAGPAAFPRATRAAGFWIRLVAIMIDSFVIILVQGALFGAGWILAGGGIGMGMAVRAATHMFVSLIDVGYRIFFHWKWGQTLGKMAMQIRVVSMDGGPLSFGQAVGRYFAAILSALLLLIGYLMAGVRSDKRALHDLLAGTRVEYT